MDRIRRLVWRRTSYEPIDGGSRDEETRRPDSSSTTRFSWFTYAVFLLIGVAMLWAWNMFLAAGPYFQRRFQSNKAILSTFQATEISVSTVVNLGSMIVLTKLQENANYPRRIVTSLLINIVAFTLLAFSTKLALGVSAGVYFAFLILLVLVSSLATGFMQNGAFAYASGFAQPEYMQAIMFGQAVAGVLPPLVQMATVLSAGGGKGAAGQERSSSAFTYFLTATGVSGATLLAFFYLTARYGPRAIVPQVVSATDATHEDGISTDQAVSDVDMKSVSMMQLAQKLFYPASAVFFTFGITMVFPVFTQVIVSTSDHPSAILQKAAFIPLAFLIWNVGDLIGRLVPLIHRLSLAGKPKILLLISLCRLIFIPLYLVCNIQPPESSSGANLSATVRSDAFYLMIVQFPFGLTNGYLGSCSMMGAGSHVEEEEREAAGSFMGLVLVAGLAVGSLCSFLVGSAIG